MKQTHDNYYQKTEELARLIDLLSVKSKLMEKTRINLYLPRAVVKIMDLLSKDISRGKLVSSLIIAEVKKKHKLPSGMFSPLAISKKEIEDITSSWEKTVNELT